MNVLSLFDGMSCGRIALERARIPVTNYYASEVDKHAIKVSQSNYPDIVQLGDINNWKEWEIEKPDLIMGGSPCQGFSFAGKQLAFDDPRSKLFFVFVDILKHYKPTYFLLENVLMKKEYEKKISNILGVEPICINSALVSAQNRRRLYWTNIQGINQPQDRGILLKDIIQQDCAIKNLDKFIIKKEKASCLDANYWRGCDNHGARTVVMLTERRTEEAKKIRREYQKLGRDFSPRRGKELVPREDGKSNCLTEGLTKEHIVAKPKIYRKLTPTECEILQTVPEGYTSGVSNSARYKMLGNGWTVDVIVHILRSIV